MVTNVKTQQQKAKLVEDGKAELVGCFVTMCNAPINSATYYEAARTFDLTRQMLINQGESWNSLRDYVHMTVLQEVGR